MGHLSLLMEIYLQEFFNVHLPWNMEMSVLPEYSWNEEFILVIIWCRENEHWMLYQALKSLWKIKEDKQDIFGIFLARLGVISLKWRILLSVINFVERNDLHFGVKIANLSKIFCSNITLLSLFFKVIVKAQDCGSWVCDFLVAFLSNSVRNIHH
jgi:hypothetical protein